MKFKGRCKLRISLVIRFVVIRLFKPCLMFAIRKSPIVGVACRDSIYSVEFENTERPPDKVLERYNNDELGGYGTKKLECNPISESREVNSLYEIQKVIDNHKPKRVVEIGVASGLAFEILARKNTQTPFVGIDFNTTNIATKTKDLSNVEFYSGYANDKLIDIDLEGSLVFATSTLTCFLPNELRRFMQLCQEKKVEWIIVNEPVWFQFSMHKNARHGKSRHMEYVCWWHEFPGYFWEFGFKTITLSRYKVKKEVPIHDRYAYVVVARRKFV